jgi:hypothetical protein
MRMVILGPLFYKSHHFTRALIACAILGICTYLQSAGECMERTNGEGMLG